MLTTTGYIVYGIFGLIVYLYFCYCLQAIAARMKMSRPWYAWIPILNAYLLCRIVGKGIFWTILCCLPIIQVILYGIVERGTARMVLWCLPVISTIFLIIIAFKLARTCGRSRWYGLLLLLPFVDCIVIWTFAFGEKGYGSKHEEKTHAKKPEECAEI